MAGIGEVSAILAVAQAGLGLSQTIIAFISDVRDAPGSIVRIGTEIQTTSGRLKEIGNLIGDNENTKLFSDEGVLDAQRCSGECDLILNQVGNLLVKGGWKRQTEDRDENDIDISWLSALRWPWLKLRLETPRAELQIIKADLNLLFTSAMAQKSANPVASNFAKEIPHLYNIRKRAIRDLEKTKEKARDHSVLEDDDDGQSQCFSPRHRHGHPISRWKENDPELYEEFVAFERRKIKEEEDRWALERTALITLEAEKKEKEEEQAKRKIAEKAVADFKRQQEELSKRKVEREEGLNSQLTQLGLPLEQVQAILAIPEITMAGLEAKPRDVIPSQESFISSATGGGNKNDHSSSRRPSLRDTFRLYTDRREDDLNGEHQEPVRGPRHFHPAVNGKAAVPDEASFQLWHIDILTRQHAELTLPKGWLGKKVEKLERKGDAWKRLAVLHPGGRAVIQEFMTARNQEIGSGDEWKIIDVTVPRKRFFGNQNDANSVRLTISRKIDRTEISGSPKLKPSNPVNLAKQPRLNPVSSMKGDQDSPKNTQSEHHVTFAQQSSGSDVLEDSLPELVIVQTKDGDRIIGAFVPTTLIGASDLRKSGLTCVENFESPHKAVPVHTSSHVLVVGDMEIGQWIDLIDKSKARKAPASFKVWTIGSLEPEVTKLNETIVHLDKLPAKGPLAANDSCRDEYLTRLEETIAYFSQRLGAKEQTALRRSETSRLRRLGNSLHAGTLDLLRALDEGTANESDEDFNCSPDPYPDARRSKSTYGSGKYRAQQKQKSRIPIHYLDDRSQYPGHSEGIPPIERSRKPFVPRSTDYGAPIDIPLAFTESRERPSVRFSDERPSRYSMSRSESDLSSDQSSDQEEIRIHQRHSHHRPTIPHVRPSRSATYVSGASRSDVRSQWTEAGRKSQYEAPLRPRGPYDFEEDGIRIYAEPEPIILEGWNDGRDSRPGPRFSKARRANSWRSFASPTKPHPPYLDPSQHFRPHYPDTSGGCSVSGKLPSIYDFNPWAMEDRHTPRRDSFNFSRRDMFSSDEDETRRRRRSRHRHQSVSSPNKRDESTKPTEKAENDSELILQTLERLTSFRNMGNTEVSARASPSKPATTAETSHQEVGHAAHAEASAQPANANVKTKQREKHDDQEVIPQQAGNAMFIPKDSEIKSKRKSKSSKLSDDKAKDNTTSPKKVKSKTKTKDKTKKDEASDSLKTKKQHLSSAQVPTNNATSSAVAIDQHNGGGSSNSTHHDARGGSSMPSPIEDVEVFEELDSEEEREMVSLAESVENSLRSSNGS